MSVVFLLVCILFIVCVDLFGACESGDLDSVKTFLPHIKEALNEFLGKKKDNLLMW